MSAEEHEPGPAWWQSGSEAAPDIEALLGPDAMAAVGGVAEEALKLFVVLRERIAEPPAEAGARQEEGATIEEGQPSPWAGLLGQLASGAVSAVNELATAAQQQDWTALGGRTGEGEDATSEPVAPGEAAACAYCPVCQAIALFRSVPMDTWQRLAASVVDVADAARDFAGPSTTGGPVVVVPEQGGSRSEGPSEGTVEDFLASVADPDAAGVPDEDAPGEDAPGEDALREDPEDR